MFLSAPLLAAACGDDDDGGDVAAYCALSNELDQSETVPSDDDLDRLADLAPAEIRDEVELAVDEIKEKGEAAFGEDNDEFIEAVEAIEAFEAQNCGADDTGAEESS